MGIFWPSLGTMRGKYVPEEGMGLYITPLISGLGV